MPPVRFDHAGGSVVFSRAPLRPERSLEILQAQESSAAGVRFGYDPLGEEGLIPLRWRGMAEADAEALEAFFCDTVFGMAEEFTYIDAEGTARQVRFASPTLETAERAPGRRDVSITLMEV